MTKEFTTEIIDQAIDALDGQTVMEPSKLLIDLDLIKNQDDFSDLVKAAELEVCENCGWYYQLETMNILQDDGPYCESCSEEMEKTEDD